MFKRRSSESTTPMTKFHHPRLNSSQSSMMKTRRTNNLIITMRGTRSWPSTMKCFTGQSSSTFLVFGSSPSLPSSSSFSFFFLGISVRGVLHVQVRLWNQKILNAKSASGRYFNNSDLSSLKYQIIFDQPADSQVFCRTSETQWAE